MMHDKLFSFSLSLSFIKIFPSSLKPFTNFSKHEHLYSNFFIKKKSKAITREKGPEGYIDLGQWYRHSLTGKYLFYKSRNKILLKEIIGEIDLKCVNS